MKAVPSCWKQQGGSTMRCFVFLPVWVILTAGSVAALDAGASQTPPDVWKGYDPDAGEFKEEIVFEETKGGIYYQDAYISAYINNKEAGLLQICCQSRGRESPWPDGCSRVDGWPAAGHGLCQRRLGSPGERLFRTDGKALAVPKPKDPAPIPPRYSGLRDMVERKDWR